MYNNQENGRFSRLKLEETCRKISLIGPFQRRQDGIKVGAREECHASLGFHVQHRCVLRHPMVQHEVRTDDTCTSLSARETVYEHRLVALDGCMNRRTRRVDMGIHLIHRGRLSVVVDRDADHHGTAVVKGNVLAAVDDQSGTKLCAISWASWMSPRNRLGRIWCIHVLGVFLSVKDRTYWSCVL
jgi:hypothetical protein